MLACRWCRDGGRRGLERQSRCAHRPVREIQQVSADRQRLRLGQVGEVGLAAAVPDHLDAQFGEPERAGDERADDIDRLQPRQRYPPALAGEDAVLQSQITTLDAPPAAQPRQVAGECRNGQHDGDDQQELGARETPAAQAVLSRDGGDDAECAPPAQHRCERMQARPFGARNSGQRGRRSRRNGRVCRESFPHRPAARASPSIARRSRNRSASAAGSPGTRASLAAAAVCRRTVARPHRRSSGPATTSTNCMRP